MNIIENQFKDQMIFVGKRLDDKGLLLGTGGNFSIRISDNEMLITASGFCKSMLTYDQITKVDLEGNILSGLKPARDIRMHLAVYKNRPDVKAIVHSHPPVVTGFSISEYKFDKMLPLPEVLFGLGGIATIDFAMPTTEQVPIAVNKALNENPYCKAFILKGHGSLTLGDDIMDACFKLENLDSALKAILVTKILGSEMILNNCQMAELEEQILVRRFAGIE